MGPDVKTLTPLLTSPSEEAQRPSGVPRACTKVDVSTRARVLLSTCAPVPGKVTPSVAECDGPDQWSQVGARGYTSQKGNKSVSHSKC